MKHTRLSPRPTALSALAAALLLAGCMNLAPTYQRPAAPVPAQLPLPAAVPGAMAEAPAIGADTGTVLATTTPARPLGWQAFVQAPALQQLIERALNNNRDLRVAVLNVERARALVGASEADRLPTLGAGLTASRAPGAGGRQATSVNLGLQVAAWEADFFGRIANLNEVARAQLLATEAGRRSAELALVGAVVSSHLSLAADVDLSAVAERTAASREATLKLTQLRFDAGAASQLELQAAQSLAAQARVTRAQLARQRAQNLNALALLLGEPVPAALVPQTGAAPAAEVLAPIPVSLDSAVLLARPDVIQSEQALIAANANIGIARAAFYPRLTLTTSAGLASSSLTSLFEAGTFAWTLSGQALATIFDSGRNQANLDAAKVGRDIAVAQYERAVQSAFRDTADALAGLATWRDQLAAQQQQLQASREIARLTELRYSKGAASELERLDAQRNLDAAEQAVVQTRLAEQLNRVALFKALGG